MLSGTYGLQSGCRYLRRNCIYRKWLPVHPPGAIMIPVEAPAEKGKRPSKFETIKTEEVCERYEKYKRAGKYKRDF